MRGVIMLVNSFPPVPAGGAERQAERLSTYLGSQNIPVRVITRSAAGLPRTERLPHYWVERIPELGFGKLKTITFMIGATLTLIRHRHSYDILHAHLAFAPALVAALIARLLNKRVIVKYGTSGKYGDIVVSQRTIRGRIRLALLRRWTDMSIALDSAMEEELLQAQFPPERVMRVDNGIDEQAFIELRNPSAKHALGLANRCVVIYTGRLVSQKSLPILLHAFHDVSTKYPHVHLLIVGQGPEREQLEELAKELGIHPHITFVGNVQDVRPYLSASDIFVLPSEGEGISNALLEAMAAGLACIATTVGGSAEVLDQGACGMLIPVGGQHQLSAALSYLVQNPTAAEHFGRSATQRIQTRYALSVVGEQYRCLYTNLIHHSLPLKQQEEFAGE